MSVEAVVAYIPVLHEGYRRFLARHGVDRPVYLISRELLAHQRPVDYIFLKPLDEPRWALIKAVAPDVLVLTEDHSYSEAEQAELLEIVGRIEVVTRQASVTTSERIRQMYMHMGERLGPELGKALPDLIDRILRRP